RRLARRREAGLYAERRPHRAQRPVLVRIREQVQEVSREVTARRRLSDVVRLAIAGTVTVALAAGYAAFRVIQQGDRDEQRVADAIVVLGAAQYDGRPS